MLPSVHYHSDGTYCNFLCQNSIQDGHSCCCYDCVANFLPPTQNYTYIDCPPYPIYGIQRTMATTSSELDDFQRLSDEYRAELPGPLIGEKLPMDVLATEYAQADPTFVVKTAALAQKYSAYRIVKGDGQCGWRGTVFAYFETLLLLGDVELVQQERVRLQSFEDTMRMAGIDYDIMIDMFDYTWELFGDLQEAVERQDSRDTVLLNVLNDEIKSDSIVYHFKMMTSAYMQLRADQYEPFLELPIAEYRVSRIDPSNQEIDQIGLQALTDAVIAPANFALEVLYLDRSTGEEVTPHQFVADPAGKPTIRLLYRPGHYDIIYKDPNVVQVFLQKDTLISHRTEMAESTGVSGDLQAYLFPGPEAVRSQRTDGGFYDMQSRSTMQSSNEYDYARRQQLLCLLPFVDFESSPYHSASSLAAEVGPNFTFQYPSPCSTEMSSSPQSTTSGLSSTSSLPITTPKKSNGEPQIRLNANCFNYRLKHESVPLCTQAFGSTAALSTAHFRNEEFQPHIWRAEEEYLKA